jgi:hypothetical protein
MVRARDRIIHTDHLIWIPSVPASTTPECLKVRCVIDYDIDYIDTSSQLTPRREA